MIEWFSVTLHKAECFINEGMRRSGRKELYSVRPRYKQVDKEDV